MSTARIDTPAEVIYPESDGVPVGEATTHYRAILSLVAAFGLIARGRDLFVAADLFLYDEEGNPRAVKAPDLMVVRGIAWESEPRIFKTWVEGRVPCLVVEVTSSETRNEDFGPKRDLYARLGVGEYFLFDPLDDDLSPPLQGYRLDGRRYAPIVPDADGSLISQELRARLIPDVQEVRVQPLDADAPLPTLFEAIDGYRDEKERAEAEKGRADALAAEVERLPAMLGEAGDEGRGRGRGTVGSPPALATIGLIRRRPRRRGGPS